MRALAPAGFPVPRVFGLCEDDAVIGSAFFVMEMVEGRIFWDATFPQVPDADRPAYFDAMNRTMARLHSVDHVAAGLGDYGRPGNYFARQIGRWSRQYLADPEAGRDPDMDRLVEWLPENIPPGDETGIVHGDFRCDNMIFAPDRPEVIAVLDWELSTLGHPLGDFAFNAMMYRMPPDIVAGLAGADLRALNIPSEAEYVAAYCRRTGRDGIDNWEFYIAFNFFRLAAIFHGIKGRALRGTAASAHAAERGEKFPRLARLAAEAMAACDYAGAASAAQPVHRPAVPAPIGLLLRRHVAGGGIGIAWPPRSMSSAVPPSRRDEDARTRRTSSAIGYIRRALAGPDPPPRLAEGAAAGTRCLNRSSKWLK